MESNATLSGTGIQLTGNPLAVASLGFAIAMIFVAVIGITVNALIVHIFSHRSLLSSINTLLTGLAIADMALLLTAVPLYATVAIYGAQIGNPSSNDTSFMNALDFLVAYMTVYLYPFTSIFQTASVWIMVLITIERYLAVCYPFAARTTCTWQRAVYALVAVCACSTMYNVSRFWDYEVTYDRARVERNANLTGQTLPTPRAVFSMRCNKDYFVIYVLWGYFLFVFALPFVAIAVLNALIVVNVRKAQQFRAALSRRECKEYATAYMLAVASAVFLICNSLAFILNALDAVWGGGSLPVECGMAATENGVNPVKSDLFFFLTDLNNLLVMTHCCLNFFVYLAFSKRFRRYFVLMTPLKRYCKPASRPGTLLAKDSALQTVGSITRCSSCRTVENDVICASAYKVEYSGRVDGCEGAVKEEPV